MPGAVSPPGTPGPDRHRPEAYVSRPPPGGLESEMAQRNDTTTFAGYALGAGFLIWLAGLGPVPLLTAAAAVCVGRGALRGVYHR